jgi:hypothetical protein
MMSEFKPGDKVTAIYGALLDGDGQPMTAEVLHEHPDPADDAVLIRYRCADGSATDSWEKPGNLIRLDGPGHAPVTP